MRQYRTSRPGAAASQSLGHQASSQNAINTPFRSREAEQHNDMIDELAMGIVKSNTQFMFDDNNRISPNRDENLQNMRTLLNIRISELEQDREFLTLRVYHETLQAHQRAHSLLNKAARDMTAFSPENLRIFAGREPHVRYWERSFSLMESTTERVFRIKTVRQRLREANEMVRDAEARNEFYDQSVETMVELEEAKERRRAYFQHHRDGEKMARGKLQRMGLSKELYGEGLPEVIKKDVESRSVCLAGIDDTAWEEGENEIEEYYI